MKKAIQYTLASTLILSAFAAALPAHAEINTSRADRLGFVVYSNSSFSANHAITANQKPIKLAQKKISPAKAKAIARSKVKGGEVVDISLKKNTYRVRVISKNGRVVDVLIDAASGRVK